jgi:hypothetical protein
MSNDYAKMTADLIARMSRPRANVLCSGCHTSIPAPSFHERQCAGCGADDRVDDIELEAVTRSLPTAKGEVQRA